MTNTAVVEELEQQLKDAKTDSEIDLIRQKLRILRAGS